MCSKYSPLYRDPFLHPCRELCKRFEKVAKCDLDSVCPLRIYVYLEVVCKNRNQSDSIMEIETFLLYSYPILSSVKFKLNPITLSVMGIIYLQGYSELRIPESSLSPRLPRELRKTLNSF